MTKPFTFGIFGASGRFFFEFLGLEWIRFLIICPFNSSARTLKKPDLPPSKPLVSQAKAPPIHPQEGPYPTGCHGPNFTGPRQKQHVRI